MKNFLVACAALCLLMSASAQSLAPPVIAARSWLVMDASSGQVTQAEYEFPAAPVPTPGACALLGAAAVMGGTKRRRG